MFLSGKLFYTTENIVKVEKSRNLWKKKKKNEFDMCSVYHVVMWWTQIVNMWQKKVDLFSQIVTTKDDHHGKNGLSVR